MSAFIGFIPFSKSWRPATEIVTEVDDQLSIRIDAPLQSVDEADAWLRVRSHRSGDFYVDDEVAVAVDGTFDWIDLDDVEDHECHEQAGATVARLYKALGLDWLGAIQGSFSITIINRKTGTVSLVRDKFGTKPWSMQTRWMDGCGVHALGL